MNDKITKSIITIQTKYFSNTSILFVTVSTLDTPYINPHRQDFFESFALEKPTALNTSQTFLSEIK